VRSKQWSCSASNDTRRPDEVLALRKRTEEASSGFTCGSLSEADVGKIVENLMGWLLGETQSSGKVQARIGEF
jgi:hypothetical protein